MNRENGCPTCDACNDDIFQNSSIAVVLHWDEDTDYNQLEMCPECAIKYASKAKMLRVGNSWFIPDEQDKPNNLGAPSVAKENN